VAYKLDFFSEVAEATDLAASFSRCLGDATPGCHPMGAFHFPINTWPQWAREAFFCRHKYRNARMMLYLFFFKNGMPPNSAAYWVMAHQTYDQSAHNSIRDLVRLANNDPGHYLDRPGFKVLSMHDKENGIYALI
jgi:hypothetical protein